MTSQRRIFSRIRNWIYGPIGAMALILSPMGCLFQGDKSDPGKSLGITGRFVDSAGHKLPGVRVLAMPVNSFRLAKASQSAARGESDSALTDASGGYAFPKIGSGTYNLVADNGQGGLVALIPDISYLATEGQLELGTDTLHAPGSIKGRLVRVGRGVEGVVMYLPGTSYLAVSDSNGDFLATGIPPGSYAVNYLVPGFLVPADTGIPVLANRTTYLPERPVLYDTSLPPPAPLGIRAVLDSLHGRIHLRWDRVDVPNLLGYLVYRDSGRGSAPGLINPLILLDTEFTDSPSKSYSGPGDTIEFNYRVRSIDKGKNISASFSPVISVRTPRRPYIPPYMSLAWDTPYAGLVASGDSAVAIFQFHNPDRSIREIVWKRSDDTLWSLMDTLPEGDGRMEKTFVLATLGSQTVGVYAQDPVNGAAPVHATINVVEGRPEADAGQDQILSFGDPVYLSGKEIDRLSTVVKREWDIGGHGDFKVSENGSVSFVTSTQPETLLCVYRATNAKGLHGEDTARIFVISDPPDGAVSGPQEVFAGDTIRLTIDSFTDRRGYVAEWGWEIGPKGVYSKTTRMDTAWVAGSADTLISCVLRFKDDDGQMGRVEFPIRIRPRTEWIKITDKTPFFSEWGVFAWEYDDRLWLSEWDPLIPHNLGERAPSAMTTSDMVHWKLEDFSGRGASPRAPTPIRAEGGRIWGILDTFGMDSRLYSSKDGNQWDSVSIPTGLADKVFYVAEPFQGELFVFGSADGNSGQEIWATKNGSAFSLATKKAAYGNRFLMKTASQSGKIWLYGGAVENQVANDVWSSADGFTWSRVTDSALGQPRHMAAFTAFGNEFWIMGGEPNSGGYNQEIWRSSDGKKWSLDSLKAPEIGGYPIQTFLVQFRGRLLLIVQHSDRNRERRTEIWMAP